MYLKIVMSKDKFQILEQDTRASMEKIAKNGIKIIISNCPELRGYSRKLFLRGRDSDEDDTYLYYSDCAGDNFTKYLRALEEVVDRFVIRLK